MNNEVQTNPVGDMGGKLVIVPPMPPETTPTLPPSVRVARGKGFVDMQVFAPTGGASAVKAMLKAANPKLSSKALSAKVNETLRGERNLREQLGLAYFQATCQAGFVPTHGEHGRKSAVIRFTLAPEPVKAPEPKPETKETIEAEIAKLNAKLAALASSK